MIPIGRSRCGLTASSAVVETASNPTYARKTIAAAVATPLKPKGRNGVQFDGWTYQTVSRTKVTITATLTMTMTRLTRALSLMPRTSSQVRNSTMAAAGRLITPGFCPHGAATIACGMLMPDPASAWSTRLTR